MPCCVRFACCKRAGGHWPSPSSACFTTVKTAVDLWVLLYIHSSCATVCFGRRGRPPVYTYLLRSPPVPRFRPSSFFALWLQLLHDLLRPRSLMPKTPHLARPLRRQVPCCPVSRKAPRPPLVSFGLSSHQPDPNLLFLLANPPLPVQVSTTAHLSAQSPKQHLGRGAQKANIDLSRVAEKTEGLRCLLHNLALPQPSTYGYRGPTPAS